MISEISLNVYTDGAVRGNPGPGSWACIIVNEKDEIISKNAGYLGDTTNNAAEYWAIFNALRICKKLSNGKITVHSDSQLAVKQLNEEFKLNKQHLIELKQKVEKLRREFKDVTFVQVRRSNSFIQIADSLCNKVLDEKN